MPQKERLTKIVKDSLIRHIDKLDSLAKNIVGDLIANGVIVPPCKVGDKVFVVNGLWVSEYTVMRYWYDGLFFNFRCENEEYAADCWVFTFFDERIGKTVFLTREEAEKALAERGNND